MLGNASLAISLAPSLLKFVIPNGRQLVDRIQEDEADQPASSTCSGATTIRARCRNASPAQAWRGSTVASAGFMGDPERLDERPQDGQLNPQRPHHAAGSLSVGSVDLAAKRGGAPTTFTAEMKAKLDAGELIGSTAEFEAVMADSSATNGIRAYYYDCFRCRGTTSKSRC